MKTFNFKKFLSWILLGFSIILFCLTVSFAQTVKINPASLHTVTASGQYIPDSAPGSDLHLEPLPLHVYKIIIPEYVDTFAFPDPGPTVPETFPPARTSESPGMGIEDQTTSIGNFEIYPNPSSGQFTLNFNVEKKGDLKVRMMDITGREIYTQRLTGFSGTYTNAFDLSDKGKGLYIVSIEQNKQLYTKKVIID